MIIKVKLGDKGQLVIPKVVRESLGLKKNGAAILEVKKYRAEIRALPKEDLVKKAEERAKKYGGDTSKWVKRVS